jgi:Flp pilus assembly pilin Flp
MNRLLSRMWHEEDGVLSFEWTLLLTLLALGVVGGLAAARDAIIDELGDLAQAAQGIDQSYSLSDVDLNLTINGIPFTSTTNPSQFAETAADQSVTDGGRSSFSAQTSATDGPS